jgi:hypothetical protein
MLQSVASMRGLAQHLNALSHAKRCKCSFVADVRNVQLAATMNIWRRWQDQSVPEPATTAADVTRPPETEQRGAQSQAPPSVTAQPAAAPASVVPTGPAAPPATVLPPPPQLPAEARLERRPTVQLEMIVDKKMEQVSCPCAVANVKYACLRA